MRPLDFNVGSRVGVMIFALLFHFCHVRSLDTYREFAFTLYPVNTSFDVAQANLAYQCTVEIDGFGGGRALENVFVLIHD